MIKKNQAEEDKRVTVNLDRIKEGSNLNPDKALMFVYWLEGYLMGHVSRELKSKRLAKIVERFADIYDN